LVAVFNSCSSVEIAVGPGAGWKCAGANHD
jgi:hypothetical protein